VGAAGIASGINITDSLITVHTYSETALKGLSINDLLAIRDRFRDLLNEVNDDLTTALIYGDKLASERETLKQQLAQSSGTIPASLVSPTASASASKPLVASPPSTSKPATTPLAAIPSPILPVPTVHVDSPALPSTAATAAPSAFTPSNSAENSINITPTNATTPSPSAGPLAATVVAPEASTAPAPPATSETVSSPLAKFFHRPPKIPNIFRSNNNHAAEGGTGSEGIEHSISNASQASQASHTSDAPPSASKPKNVFGRMFGHGGT
jgi:hypothetical protein